VDPLAVAAWAARNQEDGVEAEPPTAILGHVVDVRLPVERERQPADAEHVEELSVAELRGSSRVRPTSGGLVVCERGSRSAEAARLLKDRGGGRYLGGGLQWREAARTHRAEGPSTGARGEAAARSRE
jgi:rhodanese-related sulfurtransferase